MFIISKRFSFCAGHRLDQLPADHPCARLHGHNYTVEVVLRAVALNPDTGFVMDYRDMSSFARFLDISVDHRSLNELMPDGKPPTAENLAEWFYNVAVELFSKQCEVDRVRVSETDKTWAEYVPTR
jgi:6-pyruvoyltetrahydropterin/6-carboxytetrahydropterin synthase